MTENVSKIWHTKLDASLYTTFETLGVIASEQGFNLYLVGGAVRDFFLNLPITDLDFVVEPSEGNNISLSSGPYLANVFAQNFSSEVSSVSKFGTAKIKIREFDVDVATSRSETYPSPGSLPVVVPNSLYDDLKRRDFTINSMAVSISPSSFGEVFDPFNGLDHLRMKLLHVHHRNSFQDDATRILRGFRYLSRLNFKFSDFTEKIIYNDLDYINEISGDRIKSELIRIFEEVKASEILKLIYDSGLLSLIHPAFVWNESKSKNYRFLQSNNKELKKFVLFALLIRGINTKDAETLKNRINANGLWSDVISDAVSLNNLIPDLMQRAVLRSFIYDSLLEINDLNLLSYGSMQNNERICEILCNFDEFKKDAEISFDGSKLIELGVPKGEHVGKILLELKHQRLDGKISNIFDEEKIVKEKLKILGVEPSSNKP